VFAKICGSTAATTGAKRVAVVIDYGAVADAPAGGPPPVAKTACAVVPRNATGSDVLAKVARPQADKSGLICAIDAFGTCAAASPSPSSSAAPAAKRKKSAGSTAVSVGIGLLLVVAAGGSMMAVRRRANQ
jgi:hypothetical protein